MNYSQWDTKKSNNITDAESIFTIVKQKAKKVKYKKVKLYNLAAAFDIETTSFYAEGDKRATMYHWQFGIDGYVITGRYWQEFIQMYQTLIKVFNCNSNLHLIIYVHNLGFEFQFIKHLFNWENVFSIDTREPLYALTAEGVEFRCSYKLSGYSLAKVGEHLRTAPFRKLVGDLDYDLKRNSKTPLTQKELSYCILDVLVVMAYIKECIKSCGGKISNIPLTKTGYVRRYIKNLCLYAGGSHNRNNQYHQYSELMKSLTITVDEYKKLKRAFAGGMTHASCFHSGKVRSNVTSFDLCSDYPAVMCLKYFPMSKGRIVKITSAQQFNKYLKTYCCLFDVAFVNLRTKIKNEHPISESKCYQLQKAVVDNGRVVSADFLITTLTEIDFNVIKNFYTWDEIQIGEFTIYDRGRLPKPIIEGILQLYSDKTELKNVAGKESEYMNGKEQLNSCYGMIVTDICRDEIIYTNDIDWDVEKADIKKQVQHYNKSKNRFLFYPWGVWVTSHARNILFSAIEACGNDYIYCDTDSVKIMNYKKHVDYFNEYNRNVCYEIQKAAKHYNIPVERFTPSTIKGVKKILGIWEKEGTSQLFKTLGAKRYMTMDNYEISLTCSGINKKVAVPYLINTYGKYGTFLHFVDDLHIPKGECGKQIHTYIDEPISGYLTDYKGNTERYSEYSCIHIEAADYTLSILDAYIEFLKGVQV